MSLRCNCSDHGDDAVFGPCYKCSPKPDDKPYTPRTPAERPFERVLSDDVEPGDLG